MGRPRYHQPKDCAQVTASIAVQVFLHDPLLQWQLSPSKVAKTRAPRGRLAARTTELDSDSEEDDGNPADEHMAPIPNIDARHAISRVSVKLRGLDFQEGEALSVEGTVDQLIQRATDPVLLSHHYAGWAPWL
jgi:phosphatidylinositol kinase/protein kinase (PI-3  family)